MKNIGNKLMQLCFFVGLPLLACAGTVMAAEGPAIDATQEQFLEAMNYRAEGNYYDAIDLFNTILANKPQLQRARLELAVTYRRLFDYAKARELAQQVLDDPKTSPNVRVTVQAFIAQLDHDAKTMQSASGHTWTPEVGLGWIYDTNVNAGPSAGSFIIDGVEWGLNPGSQPRSDSAAIISAGLSHQYRTGKRVPLAGLSNAILLWQDYVNYNRRDYTNEHAFDQDVMTIGTGPALVAVHNWRANISAQGDYLRLGSEDLAWFMSLLPSFTKQFANDAWEITLDGTLSKRDYLQAADEERDSDYYSGQLSIGYTFAKARVSVQAGTSTFKESADANYFSYDGSSVFGGVAWRPWQAGSIFGRVSERILDYEGKEPFFNIARHDRVRQYTAGVSHSLKSSNKWVNDLALNANFVRTDNYSNVATDEYSREQTTLMLSKPF